MRSRSRALAFVAVVSMLIALAPFPAPETHRLAEVATSLTTPAPAIVPAVRADRSGDDGIDEPARSDGSNFEGAQRDLVTDPKLLSTEAAIQRQLIEHGWTVTVDGTIGAQTRRAIAEFQHANGLPSTGSVDNETGVRLGSPDANGHQHYLGDPLPLPAPTSVPPAPRAERPAADPITRIEQIADSVGFDWRSHEVAFVLDCDPTPRRCATGSYYPGTRQIFVTRSILAKPELLRSVVLHELAHAWQFTVRGWPEAADDVSAWGRTGNDGLEAAADCLAAAWGATRTYYWSCPADARAHMLMLFEQR